MAELVLRCPVCKGPIALWAVQPTFTCHHCRWALRSNVRVALHNAFVVGAVVEVALLVALWQWLGSSVDAVAVWLAASGVAGFAAGWVVVRRFTVLIPLRPPATNGSNPSIERTATGGLRPPASAAHVER
jgi:hypothetical protein